MGEAASRGLAWGIVGSSVSLPDDRIVSCRAIAPGSVRGLSAIGKGVVAAFAGAGQMLEHLATKHAALARNSPEGR